MTNDREARRDRREAAHRPVPPARLPVRRRRLLRRDRQDGAGGVGRTEGRIEGRGTCRWRPARPRATARRSAACGSAPAGRSSSCTPKGRGTAGMTADRIPRFVQEHLVDGTAHRGMGLRPQPAAERRLTRAGSDAQIASGLRRTKISILA